MHQKKYPQKANSYPKMVADKWNSHATILLGRAVPSAALPLQWNPP